MFLPIAAQDTPDTEIHRYAIPLPGTKTVSNSDWKFRLEVGSIDARVYSVQLSQYDILGRPLSVGVSQEYAANQVFTWSSETEAQGRRLRSLELISDTPLTGTLWMWNDIFGQINGVSITEHRSSVLAVPHIPEQFFEMTTSFSVQGISDNNSRSDIQFLFVDQANLGHAPTVERRNWPSGGYWISTPEVSLSIGQLGEDVSASWGLIFGTNPNYGFTGFQTFTREDVTKLASFTQTAAVELSGEGKSQGYFLFSEFEQMGFEEELIFTNPNTERVRLMFQLVSRIKDPETGLSELRVADSELELAPLQKRITLLRDDLFPEMEGTPVWLSYRSATLSEEPQPIPVFALHFQNDLNELSMGGHVAAESGRRVLAWIPRSPEFETILEVASLGLLTPILPEGIEDISQVDPDDLVYEKEETIVKLSLDDEVYRVAPTFIRLLAGEPLTAITSSEIRALFSERFEDQRESLVTVRLEVVSGPAIIAKMSAFRGNDLAIVNPYTFTPAQPTEEDVQDN